MKVKEIIKKHLEDNGYDGLAGDECGCLLDDLCICEFGFGECVAGHKVDVVGQIDSWFIEPGKAT